MIIYVCDCCKKELRPLEQKYSIEIYKGDDKEIILDDVCEDCFDRFNRIINNAEEWRKRNE